MKTMVKLIHILNDKKMSVSALTKATGLDRDEILKIAQATSIEDIQLAQCLKIADALDIQIEDLFYEPEYEQPDVKKLAFVTSSMFRLLRTPVNVSADNIDYTDTSNYSVKFGTLRPAKQVVWRKPNPLFKTGFVKLTHPKDSTKVCTIEYTGAFDKSLTVDLGQWCPFGKPGDVIGAYEPWGIALNDNDKLLPFDYVTPQPSNTRDRSTLSEKLYGLNPPETMPEQLLRVWLQITKVDLLPFSEINSLNDDGFHILLEEGFANQTHYNEVTQKWNREEVYREFRSLWNTIYSDQKKYRTECDFLVWYIKFRRLA